MKISENLPILGVCLGAQALTCYYGGDVIQGSCVKHGKVDTLTIVNRSPLYKGIKSSFKVMRYHSLISDPCSFPESLLITGQTYDCIQSFQHKIESIMAYSFIQSPSLQKMETNHY